MTVFFLWELQSQGLVSRTLQYKQLCWSMWKECTSYGNHRKIYLYLGWLWYLTFLIGFRVLASQTPYSPLPPGQPRTGAPMSSPCLLCSCCKWDACGNRSPMLPAPQHTRAAGCLGTACCLHSNPLSSLEAKQCATYICWIKPVYGTNKEWQTNICWKTPTDQDWVLGPRRVICGAFLLICVAGKCCW